MGLLILKTPFRAPQANAFCERLVGTFRRECLDYLIPLNERHLRRILKEWVAHYNRGRPHSTLGPGKSRTKSASPQTGEEKLRRLEVPGTPADRSQLADSLAPTRSNL